jgi:hypothetical protein
MLKAIRLPVLAAAAAIASAACASSRAPVYIQHASVSVETPSGEPLAGTAILHEGQVLVRTGADGRAKLQMAGRDGGRVPPACRVPGGLRAGRLVRHRGPRAAHRLVELAVGLTVLATLATAAGAYTDARTGHISNRITLAALGAAPILWFASGASRGGASEGARAAALRLAGAFEHAPSSAHGTWQRQLT